MIVYKVAKIIDKDTFVSWIIDNPGVRVEYKLNQKSTPLIQNSSLLAFKTLEQAESYDSALCERAILECEADVIMDWNPRRYILPLSAEPWEIEEFWNNRSLFQSEENTDLWPEGTVLCSSITPKHILSILRRRC